MTTGAANDIERATKLARSMVTQYGMSDKFGMMGLESPQNQYLDGRNVLTCSESTGAAIDGEVREILKKCYTQATELLQENREALTRISEYLIEKETISGAQFMRLLKGEDTSADEAAHPEEQGKTLGEITGGTLGTMDRHKKPEKGTHHAG